MGYTSVFGGQLIYPSQLLLLKLDMAADVTLVWPLETAPDVPVFADIIQIDSATGGLAILMPDARQGSNGASTLIYNQSGQTVTIEDAGGNSIGSVADGEAWQFYLDDNTTENGVWQTFEFGAGSSSAVAAALAGAGLKAIANTLNFAYRPDDQSVGTLAIVNADRARVKQWSGGVGAATLPDPAVVGSDWMVFIRNNGSGDLTITPAAGTIDAGPTLVLGPLGSAIIYTNGTNYYTIGLSRINMSNFDFTAINVAGTGDYVLAGPTELNRISYRLTGVLTGPRNIIVPTTVQQYWIANQTSGAFDLTVKTPLGTGVVVPQGAAMILSTDGTNVVTWEGAPTTGLIPTNLGGTGLATYAQGDLLYATAAQVLARLAKNTSASRYLANTGGSNAPQWDQVNLANGVTGLLPFANLTSLAALSVLGRSANSAGVMAAISGATNEVLRVNSAGNVLGFGAIQLASSAAVAGILAATNGGTGLGSYNQGDLLYSAVANTLTQLAKNTGNVRYLSNQGASNGPAWLPNQFGLQTPLAASYTLDADDAGVIQYETTGTTSIEIPTNASVPFPDGTVIPVMNADSAGDMTITPAVGVTLIVGGTTPASYIIPAGFGGYLIKVESNAWMLITNVSTATSTVYAGYFGGDGSTGNDLPAGWSCAQDATGLYTVTHNLGTAAYFPTFSIDGTTSPGRVQAGVIKAANSFQIGWYSQTDSVRSDQNTNFILVLGN